MKNFMDAMGNANLENDKVIIQSLDGSRKSCDILVTFDCDDNGRSYICFTDNTFNERDELNIYACYSSVLEDDGRLHDIDTEEEIEMVNEVLDGVMKQMGVDN